VEAGMTPWPSPEVILQIGGWCFAAVVLGLVIAGFIRGDLVPGWVNKRETERADKAAALLEQLTGSLERVAGAVDTLVKLAGRGGGG
jgi:hypothetical protein